MPTPISPTPRCVPCRILDTRASGGGGPLAAQRHPHLQRLRRRLLHPGRHRLQLRHPQRRRRPGDERLCGQPHQPRLHQGLARQRHRARGVHGQLPGRHHRHRHRRAGPRRRQPPATASPPSRPPPSTSSPTSSATSVLRVARSATSPPSPPAPAPAGGGTSGAVTLAIATGGVTAAMLASNGCTNGQILKYNGSAWACAADATWRWWRRHQHHRGHRTHRRHHHHHRHPRRRHRLSAAAGERELRAGVEHPDDQRGRHGGVRDRRHRHRSRQRLRPGRQCLRHHRHPRHQRLAAIGSARVEPTRRPLPMAHRKRSAEPRRRSLRQQRSGVPRRPSCRRGRARWKPLH